MAHLNNMLAPGAMPVIGRMFEAAQAETAPEPRPPAAATPPVPPVLPVLPFVGAVHGFRPGAGITVARRLALEHDLYLADHSFVYAPGVKPMADCFPVLPMTVSLEAMAETAACLAPGQGLVGFESVTARRWIALEEGGALDLRIEGRVLDQRAPGGSTRIAVQVFAGDAGTAAIDATVCFGTHHEAAQPVLPPLGASTAQDAVALYGERHLFHGPRFQGLVGQVAVGAHGAAAELLARRADDWFAGQRRPQLLTDAALLDTVGQLAAVWAMRQGRAAFPIGLERLDLHGPTPAPGTRLPIRLQVVDQQLKMLIADVEIGDGQGGLWLRISGWKSWQFDWAPQLVAFQRQPAHTLLSEERQTPGAGVACRRMSAQALKGFDLALLARHYLHGSEWPAFAAKSGQPARQHDWLLGRIAAKDAARAWCGHPGLHPAAFAIVNDAAGQPEVACWPPGRPAPRIGIAHAGGQAIALASGAAVGVDIEKIVPRDEHCVASFCTARERELLAAVPDAERDAWITRLWCAKEAFGKRLGTGVAGGPHRFEAQSLAPDFSLHMRHAASGAATQVHTGQDGEFVIAFDTAAIAR
ncbi:4'-phosphopantetheinyl transferase superfamily protein [Massilia niastensis]|uniref:4'-phosphopantetheinyl transferase superfamily protein n=1 Tax=Massilia niastensis TaxID=544911 RepID=UPI0003A14B36|nr:4'-phosphopantetheinyl transferase superfamily protein [Massilia niastensis]